MNEKSRAKNKINRNKQLSKAREKKSAGRFGWMPSSTVDTTNDEDCTEENRWISHKRGLQSNHARYEESEEEGDDELLAMENQQKYAANFTELIQPTADDADRFIFGHERNWAEDLKNFENSDATKYFNINKNLLTSGLNTIPFYRRMDYSYSLFSNDEIAKMNKESEVAEKEYEVILKKIVEAGSKPTSRTGSAKSQDKKNEPEKVIENLDSKNNEETVNENLAKAEEGNVPAAEEMALAQGNATEQPEGSGVEKKEDLQEWLDGILDE